MWMLRKEVLNRAYEVSGWDMVKLIWISKDMMYKLYLTNLIIVHFWGNQVDFQNIEKLQNIVSSVGHDSQRTL